MYSILYTKGCGRLKVEAKDNADDLWIEPTLVNGNKSNFMNEEIFGPILPIITYKDQNEIEILVEKHPFPLALYIFSNDKQFIKNCLVAFNKLLDSKQREVRKNVQHEK